MKFILSILAIYTYFSFALLDSLKGLSYNTLVNAPAEIALAAEPESVLVAQLSCNKRVTPFTVD